MKVVVEVAVDSFDRRFYFSHLWDPLLKFLIRVVIIVPWTLATSVPSQICKVGGDMDFRREKRFVNNCVCHVVFGKGSPSRGLHPGPASKLDSGLVPLRKNR